MRVRRFRLATGNAAKQGNGIGMSADSILDFAKQGQQSIVLGGKLRGLLQRDFLEASANLPCAARSCASCISWSTCELADCGLADLD